MSGAVYDERPTVIGVDGSSIVVTMPWPVPSLDVKMGGRHVVLDNKR